MLQNQNNCKPAYMTVYLTLTMAILLSLCLTMIEGVRSNAIILESEIACDIAMDSIMAEYNRELLKQYNLFAIEDSYGGNNASLDNTENHLEDYLNKNFSANHILGPFLNYRDFLAMYVENSEIEGVAYLSDDEGEVLMQRAYEAIIDDIGLALISKIGEWTSDIESNGLEVIDMQGQLAMLEDKASLDSSGQEGDGNENIAGTNNSDEGSSGNGGDGTEQLTEIVEVESGETYSLATVPGKNFLSSLHTGILNSVTDVTEEISDKSIDTSTLFSSRKKSQNINSGNIHLNDEDITFEIIRRFAFQEYLLRYMGRYGKVNENDTLEYQIEYIIAGKSNDYDNLNTVVGRIFAIRFAADYMYICGDEEKKTQAELVGTAFSVVTYTESMKDLYKELVLIAWAGFEAIYDTKCLIRGKKISLFKTEESWQSRISGNYNDPDFKGEDEGMTYTDFLRVFMTVMQQDDLTARSMDIMESNIRNTPGNSKFRIDACIDTLQTRIKIASKFGYHYEFTLKRKYE